MNRTLIDMCKYLRIIVLIGVFRFFAMAIDFCFVTNLFKSGLHLLDFQQQKSPEPWFEASA